MKKVTYTVSFTHQSRTKTLFAVIMQIQCVLPRSVLYDFFPMLDNLKLTVVICFGKVEIS